MYNLQKAKEEIDAVASHTSVLTEHVLAVAERLQALEGDVGERLERLKSFITTIEASFANLRSIITGGNYETSAIDDLGAKIAQLHKVVHGGAAPSPVAPDDHHESSAEAPHLEHTIDYDHPGA